jgi:putative transposase
VARIHEKIVNSRKDNLHKVSHGLVSQYDTICLEDLNIKGMVRNKKLSKHIADASWGNFVRMIEYKADWNDRQVVKIDRFFPSSKTCTCGHKNNELKLSDRFWTCSVCSTFHDRDVLAANNILNEGLRIIGAGLSDYTGGADVRLPLKQPAVKPEAQPSLVVG